MCPGKVTSISSSGMAMDQIGGAPEKKKRNILLKDSWNLDNQSGPSIESKESTLRS